MNENHMGSDFDDFLSEEGLLEEAEATALKRVLVYQISQLMQVQNISKTEMARRMQSSRASTVQSHSPRWKSSEALSNK